jgi:hypothetical protein
LYFLSHTEKFNFIKLIPNICREAQFVFVNLTVIKSEAKDVPLHATEVLGGEEV